VYFADDATAIKLKLSGAVTTTELPITGCWSQIVEATGAMDAGAVIRTITAGTGEITLVAVAAANTHVRKLQGLAVRNSDSVAATVIIYLDDGTESIIVQVMLAVGDCLMLADDGTWRVIDSNGHQK
jgi:hypothetical protein